MLVVERAHRLLAPRPVPGSNPRPIIAQLLNYRDRDAILREARARDPVMYQGSKLTFSPDYTPAVQAARRKFASSKKLLVKSSIPYIMLYPAKLKITHEGQQHFFYKR